MKWLTLRFGESPARRERPVWIGGFNLLPHRQRAARRQQRRRVIDALAAVALGCIAVLALAVWQTVDRARLDAQRVSFERSLAQLAAPLAEHARLTRDIHDARTRAAHAATFSEPLAQLAALLDELAAEPRERVLVRQLRHRDHETELFALAADHAAPASWVKRLGAIRGVKDADVKDLRRATPARGAVENASDAIGFSARLYWNSSRELAARRPAPAAARPVQGVDMRGNK
ncbi:fimbrial assembly protein [Paraburkholderia rhizosphaerae]|uniref:Type IV pilus assembly protein PilN n=1 Tax=Paraburkholderia rhizosphaerae TaxID=480658 RepID=A0A4R8LDG4_9BURK|nr:fimbrial assembly protein [Paraburkholderia rhizosphaerae]TDY40130.1 type IV pilus assembly protein PilN [Paraburkholderia rhizosphaerae]